MRKSDAQLQQDVMEELIWDPSVGRAEIGVACRDGVITLGGQVDSYAKKDAAILAAERVSGVRAIADDLVVKIPASFRRTDTDVAHSVTESLKWDIQVPDDKIKARVDGGWVWLDGEVEWEYQRAAAERAIQYLAGVTGVSRPGTCRLSALRMSSVNCHRLPASASQSSSNSLRISASRSLSFL